MDTFSCIHPPDHQFTIEEDLKYPLNRRFLNGNDWLRSGFDMQGNENLDIIGDWSNINSLAGLLS